MKTFLIPNQFELKQKKIPSHKMNLIVEDKKFGTIKQKKSHGIIQYELYDLNKNLVAFARKKFLDLGASIQVYDAFGSIMGFVEHVFVNPLHEPIQKYRVFDGFGKLVAQTKQQNDIQSIITIFSIQGNRAFRMTKNFNILKPKWSVQLGLGIDKRVAVFIPMFLSTQARQKY